MQSRLSDHTSSRQELGSIAMQPVVLDLRVEQVRSGSVSAQELEECLASIADSVVARQAHVMESMLSLDQEGEAFFQVVRVRHMTVAATESEGVQIAVMLWAAP